MDENTKDPTDPKVSTWHAWHAWHAWFAALITGEEVDVPALDKPEGQK